MSKLRARHGAGLMLTVLAACTDDASTVAPHAHAGALTPSFTASSGSTPTVLGRATFFDPKDQNLKVKRMTGDWHMEIKAKPAFDLAVQTIVFQPGGQSGWHSHPGPVFIQVRKGTMTFYDSDDPTCTPVVRTEGQGFLDMGEHAHMARNETGVVSENVVTYFVPPGAALRIDEPAPGNCPF